MIRDVPKPARRAALAILVGLASGATSGISAEDVRRLDPAASRGATLFARSCAACHGRSGRGDGPAAADLDPPPRDLASTQYRFRTTPTGSPPTAADLERTIRRGLPGSSMPGFGDLFSAGEIEDLIAFLQYLQDSTPPDPVALRPISAATPEAVAAGRALYLLMGCSSCHGVAGSGRGPAARGLTDEAGRPIRSTDFRYDPLKGGRDPAAIVRTLVTGLNGAPMPSYSEALLFGREDVDDLSSFEGLLSDRKLDQLLGFIRSSPTREDLQSLGDRGREELREQRFAALAHYVLSLERRGGIWFRMFRQEPEREPRNR